ncbi:MAG: AAA family ATPase [Gammaproteobacteria bacterium]|nr:AAA family ATPase [Gammaproteobacteria bacterium]
MNDLHELGVLLDAHIPILAVESSEESRLVELVRDLGRQRIVGVACWSASEGLRYLEPAGEAEPHHAEPAAVLARIKQIALPGIFLLLDFHPWLSDPLNIRLLKEIALDYQRVRRTLLLVSHKLELPAELLPYSARFSPALPDHQALERLVHEEADRWNGRRGGGTKVTTNRRTLSALLRVLGGLSETDARRIIRTAIADDGAITSDDIPKASQTKFQRFAADGVLSFEYDTARFGEVGGLERLKAWLAQRRPVFLSEQPLPGLDRPRGVMLLGVQGCGKSLAAKAVAGSWDLPLLALDFGALYNKYHGETERNLRESLRLAELMSPCVLWLDELEKGVGGSGGREDGGVSRRVLATLLSWLAENEKRVFVVATANDINVLPPELIRKGRLDEVFFVDLPPAPVREEIFSIHLARRELDLELFDLPALALASEGFSGAEIEQGVVAGLYAALAQNRGLTQDMVMQELDRTEPLSRLMSERIEGLRSWAGGRTVSAH